MKKRMLYGLTLTLMIAMTSLKPGSGGVANKSGGAPLSKTGAPYVLAVKEGTCASGCHTEFGLNTGLGTLTVERLNGTPTYEPGESVEIKVRIEDAGVGNRFGFQAVAIKEYSDMVKPQIGHMELNDPSRTQIIEAEGGSGNLTGREYVTHTFDGTFESEVGANEWTFNWIAPDSITSGDIGIYVAALSANADGEMSGDYVYTSELLLTAVVVQVEEQEKKENISVYPTHVVDQITVDGLIREDLRLEIYNELGQSVDNFSLKKGRNNITIDANKNPGVYFYNIVSAKDEVVLQGKYVKL